MIRRLLTAIVLSSVLFILACQANDNANRTANANDRRETADAGTDDSWITVKTKLALIADTRTSGFETEIDTKDGTVTLSGKVDTNEAKTAAEQVARGIEGVRSVNNQLQVVPEARRAEVNAADDKIHNAIETAVEGDAALKDLSLTANSNAGVVTIDGMVDNQEQLLKYAQAIRNLPGVKAVVTTPVEIRGNKSS
ncbi:MAG TPA: BON domain-containing protein [Blastocatellia bacterium]|nr:BON domain-containing protein [Blastocatellia bacterium]